LLEGTRPGREFLRSAECPGPLITFHAALADAAEALEGQPPSPEMEYLRRLFRRLLDCRLYRVERDVSGDRQGQLFATLLPVDVSLLHDLGEAAGRLVPGPNSIGAGATAHAETIGAPGDQGGAGQAERGKSRGRRGRKPDTDPKDDKRVADAWSTGEYRTYEQCGSALGRTKKQVKDAIDRHRHRKTGKNRRRPQAPE
jgi:hypothetical protein